MTENDKSRGAVAGRRSACGLRRLGRLALCALILPGAVHAVPLNFTGTVDSYDGSFSLGPITGGSFSATLDVDLSTAPVGSVVPLPSGFGGSLVQYAVGGGGSITLGTVTLPAVVTRVQIGNDLLPPSATTPADLWGLTMSLPTLPTLGVGTTLSINLADTGGTALNGTDFFLPGSLTGFDNALWSGVAQQLDANGQPISAVYGWAAGTIDGVSAVSVPEPATLTLLLSGLLGFAALRRS